MGLRPCTIVICTRQILMHDKWVGLYTGARADCVAWLVIDIREGQERVLDHLWVHYELVSFQCRIVEYIVLSAVV